MMLCCVCLVYFYVDGHYRKWYVFVCVCWTVSGRRERLIVRCIWDLFSFLFLTEVRNRFDSRTSLGERRSRRRPEVDFVENLILREGKIKAVSLNLKSVIFLSVCVELMNPMTFNNRRSLIRLCCFYSKTFKHVSNVCENHSTVTASVPEGITAAPWKCQKSVFSY